MEPTIELFLWMLLAIMSGIHLRNSMEINNEFWSIVGFFSALATIVFSVIGIIKIFKG